MKPDLLFKCSHLSIALLSIGTAVVSGQEVTPDPAKKLPSLRMTLLPIGDTPMTGVIIVNERPVVVPPKPSELIPNPLVVKDEDGYKSMSLTMNSPSKPLRRPLGLVTELLVQTGGGYSGYVKFQLPREKEDVTIFMLRNQQSNDWQKTPHAIVFKNGIESFPLGSVRLINFSKNPVVATIGETANTIAPRSSNVYPVRRSIETDGFLPYQITTEIDGTILSLTNTAVSFDGKSRMNLVVYDRDGNSEIKTEGDERPVKVIKYFERPYTSPDAVPVVEKPAKDTQQAAASTDG